MNLESDSVQLTWFAAMFIGIMFLFGFMLPFRLLFIPLLMTACYAPFRVQLVLAGAHFPIMRLVILAVWCRLLLWKEIKGLQLTSIDRLFLWWVAVSVFMGWLMKPNLNFMYIMGFAFNALGIYFLARFSLRTVVDFFRLLECFAWIITPLAFLMLVEIFYKRNFFSALFGLPEIIWIRDGSVRAMGNFDNPIMAGSLGASFLALYVGLWLYDRKARLFVVVGILCSLIMVLASKSGGPLTALFITILGFAFWTIRFHMRWVRRAIVLGVIGLSLTMSAPVWYFIARVGDVAGGGAWHRAYTIDQAVKHFDEWWFSGTWKTIHWSPGEGTMPMGDPNHMDITNQYIIEGIRGGLLKLGLFLAIIVKSYKVIGMRLCKAHLISGNWQLFLWSLGVYLSTQCVIFLSVSYFEQSIIFWYLFLAIVSLLQIDRFIDIDGDAERTA